MTPRLLTLTVVILAFGALTALALAEVGYIGIFTQALDSWAAAQVLVDLVIVAVLACIWMVDDARARAINPWPFVVLTVAGGSFGVLFYLVRREFAVRAGDGRLVTPRA